MACRDANLMAHPIVMPAYWDFRYMSISVEFKCKEVGARLEDMHLNYHQQLRIL